MQNTKIQRQTTNQKQNKKQGSQESGTKGQKHMITNKTEVRSKKGGKTEKGRKRKAKQDRPSK